MTATAANLAAALSRLNPALLGAGTPYLSQELLKKPPLVPSRYTFLLHAVVRVGRSTQGSSWQDWETATLYCPCTMKPSVTVDSILMGHRPPVKPPPLSISGNRAGGSHYRADADSYATAMANWKADAPSRLEAAQATVNSLNEAWEKAEQEREAHAPGVAAIHEAFRSLSGAIVEGQVAPFARLRSGGKIFDIKPHTFASEHLVSRVIREGVITEGNAQAFLFVDKEQLNRTFPLDDAPATPSDLDNLHLSPLMTLALDVIRDWDIGPGNQPTVAAIAAQIQSIAQLRSMTVSDRQATELARIVRGNTEI